MDPKYSCCSPICKCTTFLSCLFFVFSSIVNLCEVANIQNKMYILKKYEFWSNNHCLDLVDIK